MITKSADVRIYLIETEAGASQQVSVFLERAFLSAGYDHHHYISELSGRRKIALG